MESGHFGETTDVGIFVFALGLICLILKELPLTLPTLFANWLLDSSEMFGCLVALAERTLKIRSQVTVPDFKEIHVNVPAVIIKDVTDILAT